jgi:polyhydroxyalkanoate synthesis regulator phasin
MIVRKFTSVAFSLLLVAYAFAAQKDLVKLKADAEKARGGHQAKLYAELADRLVDVADQEFTQGNSDQAQATVQEILEDATKAHDVSLATRGNRKEVEIYLRLTQRHLESVKQTLASDDRPPLDAVEAKLAQLRQDLQDSMFGANGKKKEPK